MVDLLTDSVLVLHLAECVYRFIEHLFQDFAAAIFFVCTFEHNARVVGIFAPMVGEPLEHGLCPLNIFHVSCETFYMVQER